MVRHGSTKCGDGVIVLDWKKLKKMQLTGIVRCFQLEDFTWSDPFSSTGRGNKMKWDVMCFLFWCSGWFLNGGRRTADKKWVDPRVCVNHLQPLGWQCWKRTTTPTMRRLHSGSRMVEFPPFWRCDLHPLGSCLLEPVGLAMQIPVGQYDMTYILKYNEI